MFVGKICLFWNLIPSSPFLHLQSAFLNTFPYFCNLLSRAKCYLTLSCVLYAFVNPLLFGILLRIPIISSDAKSKISITGVCEQVYCHVAFVH